MGAVENSELEFLGSIPGVDVSVQTRRYHGFLSDLVKSSWKGSQKRFEADPIEDYDQFELEPIDDFDPIGLNVLFCKLK